MNFSANLPPPARRLAELIIAAGGRAVVVGGAIRDYLLGLPPKDIDIEAYDLPIETLQAALEREAKVHAVGKSFGVLKSKIGGMDIDVSLPRREKKAGQGHRGFTVDYDPFMPFAEAASRRDFTLNAIGVDLGSGEILDPWGGRRDLEAGLIRHVSDAFDEDPLRVLRACQFSARFGFSITPETLEKCRSLQGELATLSTERIWEEFKKLLLKAPKPSLGMAALEATGALILFPELAALRGEVWTQNNRVLDVCALYCRDGDVGAAFNRDLQTIAVKNRAHNIALDENDALRLMLAALCHNLIDEAPTRSLLGRIGCPPSLIERVVPLVLEHEQPHRLALQNHAEPVAEGIIRRLALRVPILPLCLLAWADFQSRSTEHTNRPCEATDWLLAKAESLGVLEQAPRPILQGRDAQALGLRPGPDMGALLKAAFEAQLDGEFDDLSCAVAWARAELDRRGNPQI